VLFSIYDICLYIVATTLEVKNLNHISEKNVQFLLINKIHVLHK